MIRAAMGRITVQADPACYYRDPSFLYPLQSHTGYWFCVGVSQRWQTIMGILDDNFRTIIFNEYGDFLDMTSIRLPRFGLPGREKLSLAQVEAFFEEQVATTRGRLGLVDGCVRVKRFCFPELRVGITDLPDELQDFVRGASHLDQYEMDDDLETLKLWKEEDLFVFCWGQSFTIDKNGEVVSS